MKKFLVLFLSLVMLFTFVACSPKIDKNDEATKQPTQSTEQTAHPDDETKVPDTEDIKKVDNIVDFSDVVPDGGIYYHNNIKWENCRKIFEFELGEKITAGQTMPEIADGDIFIYKAMCYVYNGAFSDEGSYGLKKANLNGWSVYCLSAENLEEIHLLNTINEKPVVRAAYVFQYDNINVEVKQIIVPENIKDISYLLDECKLRNDISIILKGTPEKYTSCLNISVDPTFNEDKITFESPYTITITGNCDDIIKNAIAGETEVAMVVEVK